ARERHSDLAHDVARGVPEHYAVAPRGHAPAVGTRVPVRQRPPVDGQRHPLLLMPAEGHPAEPLQLPGRLDHVRPRLWEPEIELRHVATAAPARVDDGEA